MQNKMQNSKKTIQNNTNNKKTIPKHFRQEENNTKTIQKQYIDWFKQYIRHNTKNI